MGDVDAIGRGMYVGMIEPAVGSVFGQIDVAEQTKRHRCNPFSNAADYERAAQRSNPSEARTARRAKCGFPLTPSRMPTAIRTGPCEISSGGVRVLAGVDDMVRPH